MASQADSGATITPDYRIRCQLAVTVTVRQYILFDRILDHSLKTIRPLAQGSDSRRFFCIGPF